MPRPRRDRTSSGFSGFFGIPKTKCSFSGQISRNTRVNGHIENLFVVSPPANSSHIFRQLPALPRYPPAPKFPINSSCAFSRWTFCGLLHVRRLWYHPSLPFPSLCVHSLSSFPPHPSPVFFSAFLHPRRFCSKLLCTRSCFFGF